MAKGFFEKALEENAPAVTITAQSPYDLISPSTANLDPEERDYLIRTVIGEARGQSPEGQRAVAHVILNRRKSGQYGSRIPDVVLAKNQFEPWQTRRNELLAIPQDDPVYQQTASIIDNLGDDLTGGATHFANVDIVRQRRGGSVTPWMEEMWNTRQQIGDHTFFGGGGGDSGYGLPATTDPLWDLANGGPLALTSSPSSINLGQTDKSVAPGASFAELVSAVDPNAVAVFSEPSVTTPPSDRVQRHGGVSNTLRGAAEQAVGIVGSLFGASASVDDITKELLGFNVKSPFEYGLEWALNVDGTELKRNVESYLTQQGLAGYEPRSSARGMWEAAKSGDVLSLAEQAIEMFVVSSPWMAVSVAGVPGVATYIAAMGEQIAIERAKNNGRNRPTADDLVASVSAATLSAALERFATRGYLGGTTGANAISRVSKAVGKEAGTEALQEPIEYAGESLGTERGFSTEEAALRSFAGAVGGMIGGGGVASVAELAGVLGPQSTGEGSQVGEYPSGIGASTGPNTGILGGLDEGDIGGISRGPVAPEGSVLQRLGGTVKNIKTKFRLTPKEESILGEHIAIVHKNDIAKTGYMKFESGADLAVTFAGQNTDERNLLFIRAPKKLKDKSALLKDIEGMDLDSKEFESRISFIGEENDNALLRLQDAIRALKEDNGTPISRLQKAESIYIEALEMGLRIRPDENAGFVVPQAPENIVPVQAPRIPSLDDPRNLTAIGVSGSELVGPVSITQLEGAKNPFINFSISGRKKGFLRPGTVFEPRDLNISRNRGAAQAVLKRHGLNLKGSLEEVHAELESNLDYLMEKGVISNIDTRPLTINKRESGIRKLALHLVGGFTNNAEPSIFVIHPEVDMIKGLESFDLINLDKAKQFVVSSINDTSHRSPKLITNSLLAVDAEGNPISSINIQGGEVIYSPEYNSEKGGIEYDKLKDIVRIEQTLKELLPKVIKALGLEKNLKVALGFSSDTRFLGAHQANSDSHVLWMNPIQLVQSISIKKRFKDPLNGAISVFTHEFGHVLSSHLAQDPNVLKTPYLELLLHQYELDALRVSINAQGDNFSKATLIPFMGPYRFLTTGTYASEDYDLNFEEWMAENAIKYALNPPVEATGALKKFFRLLAEKLQKLFEAVQKETNYLKDDFKVSTAFTLFMEYTKQRDNPHATDNFQKLYEKAMDDFQWSDELKAYVKPSAELEPAAQLVTHLEQALPEASDRSDVQAINAARLGADYFNRVVKYGWNIIQLAWKNPHIRFLQHYVGLADRWQNKKTEIQVRANERLREWKHLNKAQSDNLARMLFAVDQMEYLSPEEQAKGIIRKPREEEIAALAKKYKLNEYSLGLFKRIVEDFDNILVEIELAVIDNIRRNSADQLMAEVDIARVQKEFQEVRNRPYFPHARFGQFTIVVKDKKNNTVYMEQFESKRDRERNLKTLKAKFEPRGFTVGSDYLPDSARAYMGIPPSLLQAIKDNLTLTTEQRAALDQLIIASGPAQSFKKRFLHRQNVPGYSDDARRAFGDYFWHASNHIARITFGQQMKETLLQAGKDTNALRDRGANVTKRRQILEFLDEHLEQLMNPGPDWAWARSFAFNWWIAGSVASAALNLTQVPMVAYPYIASRFGDLKAINALKNAAVWVRKISTDPKELAKRMSQEDFLQVSLAQKQGFIDQSQATELAGIATGGYLARARHGSQLRRAMDRFSEIAGWMFAATEKYNRRIVFRAAVELARANPDAKYFNQLISEREGDYKDALAAGMTPNEAKAFIAGKDAVMRTQFEYSAYARPRFMRQGASSALFAFFMFKQNMLWFTMHSPGNIKYLLMLGLAGGLMGMPGAEDLAGLMRFFANKLFGKNFDLDTELRKFMIEAFGSQGFADLTLNGAARYGFGLPQASEMAGLPPVLPTIDMSQAISQGRIIPGLSELGRADSFEAAFSRAAADMSGAAFGVGFNLLKFLSDQQLDIDDPKRFERALPRALRDMIRASRYYAEEQERTQTGASILKFDTSDPAQMGEIIGRGLGFQPTRLSLAWDRTIAAREVEQYWQSRRKNLMQQFWNALISQDTEGKNDVLEGIKAHNKEVPYPGMAIRADQLVASVKERQRQKRLAEAGITDQKSMIAVSREVQELYPDPQSIVDVEDMKRVR